MNSKVRATQELRRSSASAKHVSTAKAGAKRARTRQAAIRAAIREA